VPRSFFCTKPRSKPSSVAPVSPAPAKSPPRSRAPATAPPRPARPTYLGRPIRDARPRRRPPCAASPATRSPGENPQPSPFLLALEFVARSPWRRLERSSRRTPPRPPAIAAAHSVPRPNPLPRVPQWLTRPTDKLPSQAAAQNEPRSAALAFSGHAPPRSRGAPATQRRR